MGVGESHVRAEIVTNQATIAKNLNATLEALEGMADSEMANDPVGPELAEVKVAIPERKVEVAISEPAVSAFEGRCIKTKGFGQAGTILPLWGNRVAIGILGGGMFLWSPEWVATRHLGFHTGGIRGLTEFQDGRLVSVGLDGRLKIWDGSQTYQPDEITAVSKAFAVNNRQLICIKDTYEVLLWSMGPEHTWTSRQLVSGGFGAMAIVPLGPTRIAILGCVGRPWIWDMESQEARQHHNAVWDIVPLADGRIVTYGPGHVMQTWDATLTTCLATATLNAIPPHGSLLLNLLPEIAHAGMTPVDLYHASGCTATVHSSGAIIAFDSSERNKLLTWRRGSRVPFTRHYGSRLEPNSQFGSVITISDGRIVTLSITGRLCLFE